MLYKRRLVFIAIIIYLLLIPLAAYFKYFPTIVNSEVTNIFIFILVFLLTSLLVYGAFIMKKSTDIYFLLTQSLIFVFIARAIPNLRLSYPPLHDPYYYYVCTLNVLRYGTLKPVLGWWYYRVNMHLHWPNMHLLTTALRHITDIDIMQLFRFQEPVMGMIFFLAVFVLAKTVTKNDGVAMLSALFASISDIIIFYQSEYHPQGFVFVYFAFLLYLYTRYKSSKNVLFNILMMIFIFVFMLSHHFSSLFLGLLAVAYLLTLNVTAHFPYLKDKFSDIFQDVRKDYNPWIIIVIAIMLSFYFIIYPFAGTVLRTALLRVQEFSADFTLITVGNEPICVKILNSTKWIVFALALISIIFIIKTKNKNEFRCAMLLVCIVAEGVVCIFIKSSPLDRLIGFYTPLAAVFGSLTVYRLKDHWFRSIKKSIKVLILVLIASVPIIASFFNSQTPAYFFQDSEINTYYWYSNDLSSMNMYEVTGEWIENYTPNESIYITEFDTMILPFYYAERPIWNVEHRLYYAYIQGKIKDQYIIVNPTIPYSFGGNSFDKRDYLNSVKILYDNGVLIVGRP